MKPLCFLQLVFVLLLCITFHNAKTFHSTNGACQSRLFAEYRLCILAELHWKLPRPLTAAEQQLRDGILPGLEASVAKLQATVQVRSTARHCNWSASSCQTSQRGFGKSQQQVLSFDLPLGFRMRRAVVCSICSEWCGARLLGMPHAG